jgi:hypothetical protein
LGEAKPERRRAMRVFASYDLVRPRQALGYQTPDAFYRGVTLTAA